MKKFLSLFSAPAAAVHIAVLIIIAGAIVTHYCEEELIVELGGFTGGVFTIRHDPWGRGLTFAGYIILTLSLAWCTLSPSGFCRSALRKLSPHRRSKGATLALAAALCLLSALLLWRAFTLGNFPAACIADTLLVTSWTALAITLWLPRMGTAAPASVAFATGAAALGMGFGSDKLSAQLQTPLLSIHVSLIMTAYTILAIIAAYALIALIYPGRRRQATLWARILLYPALFFISAGIGTGAWWADIAWGSYWNWDPKETWALITATVYLVPLHSRLLAFPKSAKATDIYLAAAFGLVLFTWFGVSYLFAGLHSYI